MDKQHVLIMHQGAIGDLVLSLPAFYAIRKKFPEAYIKLMGYPRILSLIHKRFYADSIDSVDRAGVASLYQENGYVDGPLLHDLRAFDKIFIFGGKSQTMVIQNIRQIEGGLEVYHIKTFPEAAEMHATDFQLRQLAAIDFDTSQTVPEIYLREDDMELAASFLKQYGINTDDLPLIAVHPGSGSKDKNWPLENYQSVVYRICQQCRGTILLVEGPAEHVMVDVLRGALDGITFLTLQCLDLPMLAAILKQASLFIGNDSGITHLAAALGIPTIALFGPTDPYVWGPRGKMVFIAEKNSVDRQGWEWSSADTVMEAAFNVLTKNRF